MKVSLIGYGKMGKGIEHQAVVRDDQIVVPEDADNCIDFSHRTEVLNHVE